MKAFITMIIGILGSLWIWYGVISPMVDENWVRSPQIQKQVYEQLYEYEEQLGVKRGTYVKKFDYIGHSTYIQPTDTLSFDVYINGDKDNSFTFHISTLDNKPYKSLWISASSGKFEEQIQSGKQKGKQNEK